LENILLYNEAKAGNGSFISIDEAFEMIGANVSVEFYFFTALMFPQLSHHQDILYIRRLI
jgi:hypothetical protein